MNDWRFLLHRRWAGYLLLTVVFAIVCSALGAWQFNRRTEALAEVARIDANYDAAAVSVAEALPDPDAFAIDQRWQVVALSGEYLADEEVVVRNRPFEGSSGFQVITPFRLDDGTVFMVDRGWIAQNSEGRPSDVPPPPSGHVEIEARLKAGEGRIDGRTSTGNEFATIDLEELSERVGEPSYTAAYGVLVQTGADADEPPLAAARPNATKARTSRTRCSGTSSPSWASSASPGRRTRSARRSRRHPVRRMPRRARPASRSRSGATPTPTSKTACSTGTSRARRPHASSMSSWYSRLQWSSVPSGMMSTRSGFSASTAPGSCETSTTEPS